MKLKGNPVSRGYAVGPVYLHKVVQITVEQNEIEEKAIPEAIARYESAKAQAKAELEQVKAHLEEKHSDKSEIFEAHIKILCDAAVDEEIRELIEEDCLDVPWAVKKTFGKFKRLMEKSKNPLFRERAADFEDVGRRFLMVLLGIDRKSLDTLETPSIIVCHDLLPSDSANLDPQMTIGIVTEIGGETSHSAIIARSFEIPAILGVPDAMEQLSDGQMICMDAVKGGIICDPDETMVEEYREKEADFKKSMEELRKYQAVDAVTKDGVHIPVNINIGSAAAAELDKANCVDGVGLFRSEFLYMGSDHMPTEEEQIFAYKTVLSDFKEKPVVLRTLDIGGDKTLPYFPMEKEMNPFLGERAIRLCFSHPDIFRTQLRAALRASVYGNLWLMFPMVGSLDDVRRAKQAVEDVKEELRAEHLDFSENIKVGVMIEIPSMAVIADLVAKEVDFASIGSNDLIQYTMAADRMNQRTTDYYQDFNPAVFRLIRNAAKEFNKAGKPISVCGEMGGNPLTAYILTGLGINKLSMNISSVAAVKKMILNINFADAQKDAELVCNMCTESEIKAFLEEKLSELD